MLCAPLMGFATSRSSRCKHSPSGSAVTHSDRRRSPRTGSRASAGTATSSPISSRTASWTRATSHTTRPGPTWTRPSRQAPNAATTHARTLTRARAHTDAHVAHDAQYNPCRYDTSKVIADTAAGKFTNSTGAAPSEEQLVAFVHRNGPTQTGVASHVFGLREAGCEARGDCFITRAMCDDPSVKGHSIDHSVTLVGYGTDATHGDVRARGGPTPPPAVPACACTARMADGCASVDVCASVGSIGS
jgi:hypothetical protein